MFPARNINSGKIELITLDDPRYISGEYVGIAKNKTIVKNLKTGERFAISVDDIRLKTGEVVGIMKGVLKDRIWAYNSNKKHFRILVTDPRLTSGELTRGRTR
jgi:hypothetical protein